MAQAAAYTRGIQPDEAKVGFSLVQPFVQITLSAWHDIRSFALPRPN